MERLRSLADGKTSIQLFKEINHATLDAIALVCSIMLHVCGFLSYYFFF